MEDLHITGIVLGGGQSRRMGKDKRYLEIQGQPFLDRVCQIMASIFPEVLVVNAVDDYDCSHLPVRVVTDRIPQKGSMGGLYTGLLEAKYSLGFAVACDMPFLNAEVIRRMCSLPEYDILVMRLSSGLQTLHGLYSKRCCSVIQDRIEHNDLRIQSLLADSTLATQILTEDFVRDLDPFYYSFLNVNSPADLEFVRKSGLDRSS